MPPTTPREPVNPQVGSDTFFLRTLLDTIPCPLFYKDLDGRYLGCNTAFEEMLGKPREQIIGRTVHELSPKDLADIYRGQDLALLQAPGIQTYEGQVLFADGERHELVFYKAAYKDAQGQVAGLVGVMLDITQRKLAEQRLRDTLELNEKLLGAAPIGVGVFHAATGRCVTANESLARITGGTVEKLLLQNFRELESWKRGGLLPAAERAIATEEEQHLEAEMVSSFGRRYWVSVVFTTFISGGEKHLLMLHEDISEQQAAKEALQQAQLQVIQHEKMAALGTMVSGVAHEINNPTHFMHLGAKSLETGLASFKRELETVISGEAHDVRDYLDRRFASFEASLKHILEGFGRIRAIVQDLRLFARVGESGRRETDVSEGLRLALRLTQARHPGIEVATDFAGPGRLLCFPAELNQTFLNILDNACKAIEDRRKAEGDGFQGRLEVSLRKDSAGICVIISDNGCGMPDSVKARIFEPFSTTRPVGQGAGLGLAVAYQVIEDHRGRIEVDSAPGEGTSVKVFLPFTP